MADSDSTLASRLARGAATTLAGKVIGSFLGYGSQLLLARLLGSRLFGLYALGFAVYDFAELFASLGLTSGAVRFAAIHFGARDHARLKGVLLSAVTIPLASGLAVAIALFLAANAAAGNLFGKPDLALVLRLFAIGLPLGVTLRVAAATTTAFQTTRYYVLTQDVLLQGANLVLIALFVGLGAGLPGAVIARAVASLLAALAAVHLLRALYTRLVTERVEAVLEMRQLLGFSTPLVIGEFAWLLLMWTDIVMVGVFLPSSDLGAYRAASTTASILLLFLASIGTIFAPIIADLHAQGSAAELESAFRVATRWSLSVTLPLFLAVALLDDQLLLLFGQEFTIAATALSILALGQMINAGTGGVDFMLMMSGHPYMKLAGDATFGAVNVGLNLFLIPRYGIAGAAAATAISVAALNVTRLVQVRRVLGVQPYERAFLKPLTAGIIGFVAGALTLRGLSGEHYLVQLSLTAAALATAYAITLWRLGLDEADAEVLAKVRTRLSSRRRAESGGDKTNGGR